MKGVVLARRFGTLNAHMLDHGSGSQHFPSSRQSKTTGRFPKAAAQLFLQVKTVNRAQGHSVSYGTSRSWTLRVWLVGKGVTMSRVEGLIVLLSFCQNHSLALTVCLTPGHCWPAVTLKLSTADLTVALSTSSHLTSSRHVPAP